MSESNLNKHEVEQLVAQALEAKEKAYAPYSKFRVGAALMETGGKVYTGCNVENASFGLSICAERNALFQAVAKGDRTFKAIAIASDDDEFCVPCGACRQVLIEFAKKLPVIQANNSGDFKISDIGELLPGAFSGESVTGRTRL